MITYLQSVLDLHEARYAAAVGISWIGFNFDPQAGSMLTPKEAKEINEWITGIEKIAVFGQHSTIDEILLILNQIEVDKIQLNGFFDPESLSRLPKPIVKKIAIVHDISEEQLKALITPYQKVAAYFLLDSFNHEITWGSFDTQPFEWKVIRKIASEFPTLLGFNLSSTNVEDALTTVRPTGLVLHKGVRSVNQELDFDEIEKILPILENSTSSL